MLGIMNVLMLNRRLADKPTVSDTKHADNELISLYVQNILSRASEVGSPTNHPGSRQRQDTGSGILWSVHRWTTLRKKQSQNESHLVVRNSALIGEKMWLSPTKKSRFSKLLSKRAIFGSLFFSQCSNSHLQKFKKRTDRTFDPFLLRQGEPGTSRYIVLQGK